MRDRVQVIVMPYNAITEAAYGVSATFEVCCAECEPRTSLEERAIMDAEPFRKHALAVIVRPSYNDKKLAYHEFRSFDGRPFTRVDFKACG